MDFRTFYIGSRWIAPEIPNDLGVVGPSTEEPFETISLGTASDADEAVAAARAAFGARSLSPAATRLAHLRALLDLSGANREVLARATSRVICAPIEFARSDQVDPGLVHLREAIRVLDGFEFGCFTTKDPLLYQPIGVAALITPWNWPMYEVMPEAAPPLAAGRAVVLKRSELAPSSSMLLADLIDRAGFPPGVFNLVKGDGSGVGAHLSAHPNINMVNFTGSTRAGAAISAAATRTVKRVTLEHGEMDASVVSHRTSLQPGPERTRSRTGLTLSEGATGAGSRRLRPWIEWSAGGAIASARLIRGWSSSSWTTTSEAGSVASSAGTQSKPWACRMTIPCGRWVSHSCTTLHRVI